MMLYIMSHIIYYICVISLISNIWEGLLAGAADPYIEINRNMELWQGGYVLLYLCESNIKETRC